MPVTNATGSKRYLIVMTDKAEMDAKIAANPKEYPNGTICTDATTGSAYGATDGVWVLMGTA